MMSLDNVYQEVELNRWQATFNSIKDQVDGNRYKNLSDASVALKKLATDISKVIDDATRMCKECYIQEQPVMLINLSNEVNHFFQECRVKFLSEEVPEEVAPPLLWKRETSTPLILPNQANQAILSNQENGLQSTAPSNTLVNTPPFNTYPLWTLEANGQLDSKNPQVAEQQLLNALQFLVQNPSWVNDEANVPQVKAYFIQLAKTQFSSLTQLDHIIAAYQGILSQHKERFFECVSSKGPSPIVRLKVGTKEERIPKNLLVSQSAGFKQILEGLFKKDNALLDLEELGKEDGQVEEENQELGEELRKEFREQLDSIVSYFLKGETPISGDNVLFLLDYAHQFQIPHLQEGCLRFLADAFDVDDQESFSQVWEFAKARELTELLTEELCRSLYDNSFFGKAEWEKYYGDISEVPPLPADIMAILASDCPIFEGKKVHETHILALVPEKVNDVPLTAESLGELVKSPKEGSGGHASQYNYFEDSVPDEHKTASVKSHWVLITKDVIGGNDQVNGSRNKSYGEQRTMVEEIARQTGNPYEVPFFRDMLVCLFIQHVKTGERLLGDAPWTFSRCQVDWIVVGGFAPSGVDVSNSFDSESDGMAASRKL